MFDIFLTLLSLLTIYEIQNLRIDWSLKTKQWSLTQQTKGTFHYREESEPCYL